MHGSLIPYGRWSSIIVAGVLSWPVPARCEALSGDGSVAEPCALQRSLTTGVFVAEHIPGGFTGLIDPSGFEIRDERVPGGTITRFNVLGLSRNNTPLFDWRAGDPHWSGNELFYPGGTMAVEYHHSTQGLRQNFVVYQLTAGEGALHVAMSITGDRSVRLNGESDLQFLGPDGIVQFDYRDLHCWDALNTPLHAHFELTSATHGHQLDIVVDDRDAHYPITIDPISTSPATLLIGPQTNQEYGFSVATAGDLNGDGRSDVVVGAWQTSMGGFSQAGAAYVYYGTNAGISTVASVILTSGQQGAQFGNSVSTAGDVNGDGYSDLLVGSRTWESDVVNELSEGAVFVYYGSSIGISTVANIILQPNHTQDNFGSNVACAGDINNDGYSDILVGAYLSSYPTFNEGAVFVYLGSAGGLTNISAYRLERNQGASFFGRSIAGAGDINGDGFSDIIVGSTKWIYTSGASDQGSAFVWYGSAAGLGAGPNPNPSLQLFGTGNNLAYYGWWVCGAGDLNGDGYSDVAVSAYNDNIGGETSEGLVYVYMGSAAGLNTVPSNTLQSNQIGAWMGRCVSTAGDVNGDGFADLLVGSPRYTNPESLEGIGQLFFGSATGISNAASLVLELNNAGANFGESVCAAGDVNGDGWSDMILGARIYGSSGAAAIFLGGQYGTNTNASLTRFGGVTNAQLGNSIADAGDVNGDGYTDMIVGAPGASNGQVGEGLAYVHYGSANGLPAPPNLQLEANVAGAQFGFSVSTAGDVNGDGYSDVLVGAPSSGANGRVYLFMGSAGGLGTVPAVTLSQGSQFGYSVATAGDVNTDGYSDIIIGSPGSNEAFVFRGTSSGLATGYYFGLTEPQAGAFYGCSVSTAGDVNGDGYSDVIVGARNYSNGQSNEGVAFIYHGGVSSVNEPYSTRLEVNQAAAGFGVSVSGASDVNGDGYMDVVVGADLWEQGQTDEGAAFLFYGTAAGVNPIGYATLQRNQTGGHMGHSVAEGGDVNGDGYADVIVGAPLNANGQSAEGLVYVYHGSSAGIVSIGYEQLEQNSANYQMGIAVAGGGDVDGDGYSDVLAGAPVANPSFSNEGAGYWFRGCVAKAYNRLTRQYDADLVTPMSTNSVDFSNFLFFGIGHRARSPIQRCKARLRWEVVFEGQPYTGAPITNSVTQTGTGAGWSFLPLAGVEIKQLIAKVPGHLRYKWRVRVEYDLAKLIDGQRFSRWFYGFAINIGDIGVLPIELTSFDGKPDGEVNDLWWTTATEHNSDHFDVMRGADSSTPDRIGTVNASGESQHVLGYAFTDLYPAKGASYYRLRMVDRDGAFELSDAIVITRDQGIVSIYPDPALDAINVVVGERGGASTLTLLDASGRVVRTISLTETESSMLREVDITALNAGTYILMLSNAQGAMLSARPFIKR